VLTKIIVEIYGHEDEGYAQATDEQIIEIQVRIMNFLLMSLDDFTHLSFGTRSVRPGEREVK
jgi:hypothetical protein